MNAEVNQPLYPTGKHIHYCMCSYLVAWGIKTYAYTTYISKDKDDLSGVSSTYSTSSASFQLQTLKSAL